MFDYINVEKVRELTFTALTGLCEEIGYFLGGRVSNEAVAARVEAAAKSHFGLFTYYWNKWFRGRDTSFFLGIVQQVKSSFETDRLRSIWQATQPPEEVHFTQRLSTLFQDIGSLIFPSEIDDSPYARTNLAVAPRSRLEVNPAQISSHPAQHLLQLSEKMAQNSGNFPTISYENSPGVDLGGVTKDFWAKIVKALGEDGQTALPLRREEGGFLPTLNTADSNAMKKEDQIKCYRGIGTIFGMSLRGEEVRTPFFHPLLFKVIHSLTQREIDQISAHLENVEEIPRDIYKKLFRIYLQDQWKAWAVTDEEIDQLLHEREPLLPERLKNMMDELDLGISSAKELIDYSRFEAVALPTLLITKAMVQNLSGRTRWDAIKTASPESLQEKIAGSLTREQVLAALQWQGASNAQTKGFLERWIREATQEQLEQFVQAITGQNRLSSKNLEINCQQGSAQLPSFHTCFNRMDLPAYSAYPTFKEKLETSFSCLLDSSGFQIA